jgi:hypothetical protein
LKLLIFRVPPPPVISVKPIADLTELPFLRHLTAPQLYAICGATDPSNTVVGRADFLGLPDDSQTRQAIESLFLPNGSLDAKRDSLLALARQCPLPPAVHKKFQSPFALVARQTVTLDSPKEGVETAAISLILPGGLPTNWIEGEFGALFDVVPPNHPDRAWIRIVYGRDADGEERLNRSPWWSRP